MITIALYDVMEIQDFIFSSSKLKENLGASLMVSKIFEEMLVAVIKAQCPKSISDWRSGPAFHTFAMQADISIDAEILYVGGGNAMVAYRKKSIAVDVTKALSRRVLEQAGGMLKFAVSYVETDCANFSLDKDTLFLQLKFNKYKAPGSMPLLGIGITRAGVTDGLPVCAPGTQEEFLSKVAANKRNCADSEALSCFRYLIPEDRVSDWDFPLEFDDLGQYEGESHIAIIHIDGNNMGQFLDEVLDKEPDYQNAVCALRQFSSAVDTAFKKVMGAAIAKIIDTLSHPASEYDLHLNKRNGKTLLPLRPIVLSGDDVTFVSEGRLGIPLAELFLKQLAAEPDLRVGEKKIHLSACGGVAIVKPHFPFYKAYGLAEELCVSAKNKCKITAKNKPAPAGSWLDFHIVYSGVTASLDKIREKDYMVPGMDPPDELQHGQSGGVFLRQEQYNLLWRPWCVAGQCAPEHSWDDFKKMYRSLVDKSSADRWARSRLKGLRSALITSKHAAELHVKSCESRSQKLPSFCDSNELFRGTQQTPYFDVLELMDFYMNLS